MNRDNNLLNACESVMSILNSYYTFHTNYPIENFLLDLADNTDKDGQVLFEEQAEDFFIGIQFSKKVLQTQDSVFLSLHQVSIIAEELSHFKLISDCVQNGKKTSLLKLETLGEIDRFLCVMHWNYFSLNSPKIYMNWKNIHDICDAVFTGSRFKYDNTKIYIEAENLAFKHLKNAFAEAWDYSRFNFAVVNKFAQNYLNSLRNQFLA